MTHEYFEISSKERKIIEVKNPQLLIMTKKEALRRFSIYRSDLFKGAYKKGVDSVTLLTRISNQEVVENIQTDQDYFDYLDKIRETVYNILFTEEPIFLSVNGNEIRTSDSRKYSFIKAKEMKDYMEKYHYTFVHCCNRDYLIRTEKLENATLKFKEDKLYPIEVYIKGWDPCFASYQSTSDMPYINMIKKTEKNLEALQEIYTYDIKMENERFVERQKYLDECIKSNNLTHEKNMKKIRDSVPEEIKAVVEVAALI